MDGLVSYWEQDPISFVIIGVLAAAILSIIIGNLRSPSHIYRNFDRLIDRIATVLNVAAAALIMVMAWMVLVDVVALAFEIPVQGVTELIADSVIVVLFMQIPLAIRRGGMIRTTLLYDNANQFIKNTIDFVSYSLGFIFFACIAFGGWENMIIGFQRQEFENVGNFTIPLWPLRYVTTWFSVLAATIYALELANIFLKTPEERVAQHGEATAH